MNEESYRFLNLRDVIVLEKSGLLSRRQVKDHFENLFSSMIIKPYFLPSFSFAHFSTVLRNCGAILSGSVFPLLCGDIALEDFLSTGDVDIFVSLQHIDLLVQVILNNRKRSDIHYHELEADDIGVYRRSFNVPNDGLPITRIVEIRTGGGNGGDNDEHYNDHGFCGIKVQIIGMDSSQPKLDPREVISRFDLDFCKNWYDGSLLHFNDSLISKQSVFHYTGDYVRHRRIKRLIKYSNRGYIIDIQRDGLRCSPDVCPCTLAKEINTFCVAENKLRSRDFDNHALSLVWSSCLLFITCPCLTVKTSSKEKLIKALKSHISVCQRQGENDVVQFLRKIQSDLTTSMELDYLEEMVDDISDVKCCKCVSKVV